MRKLNDSNDKRTIKVSIHGKEYPVASDKDEAYVRKVADYVDSKMKEFAASSKTFPSPLKVAVYTALNIADELLAKREPGDDNYSELDEQLNIDELNNKLQEALKTVNDEDDVKEDSLD